MPSLKVTRVAALVLFVLVVYYGFPALYRVGDRIRQTNPFSGQKNVEQDFVPTERELACLEGAKQQPMDDPIPNIVHFIMLGLKVPHDNPGASDFTFLTYLAIRSAIVSLQPDNIFFHYSFEPDARNADPFANPWIHRLKRHIRLVAHQHPDKKGQHLAHLADTLRLELLRDQGGIYLDTDAFALRPFSNLLQSSHPHDIVMGNEGGNRAGLCNAIMAARPNSSFVTRWLETYEGVDLGKEWNYHSVILPKELAANHPDEICELPPDAFFWPTWTWRHVEWMHEPMDEKEARFWQGEIRRTGGSLFDRQLAYHAWAQMARARFLRRLTPETVRTRDTRFNLLMRRFMEDDDDL